MEQQHQLLRPMLDAVTLTSYSAASLVSARDQSFATFSPRPGHGHPT